MNQTSDSVTPQQLDSEALRQYLEQHLPDFRGPVTFKQFTGGQSNPTFLLETADRRYVLRKKPTGILLATAHMIEREYRVIRALADTRVPVAPARLLCEDPTILGTAFYVMDFVEGRLFTDPRLPQIGRNERARMFGAMIRTLGELHCVDYKVIGLGDFGKPGQYIARQIHRWSGQYRKSETTRIEAMESLLKWVPDHIPADDSVTINHGDYRLGNLIFEPSAPAVRAVLDWELSTLGHPLCDLAYCCLMYRLPMGMSHFDGLDGANLRDLGLPPEQELLEQYCRVTGRDCISNWSFYVAFSLFRIAAISQGVYQRALQGNAADAASNSFGAIAQQTAQLAWQIAQTPD